MCNKDLLLLLVAAVVTTKLCSGMWCTDSFATPPPPGSPPHVIQCDYYGKTMMPGSSITNMTACETCWCTKVGTLNCCLIGDRPFHYVSLPPECKVVEIGQCKHKAVHRDDGSPCQGLAVVSR